jgi:hypothetical protein
MHKIYHFYHIYADGDWIEAVENHIKVLIKYELIDNMEPIKIGIVGNEENINNVKEFLDSKLLTYEIIAEDSEGWEQLTQNKLHEFSQDNDGIVLYAHTKGATSGHKLWRDTMTFYNIVNWKECISLLDEYDTVGCFWLDKSHKFNDHNEHNGFYAGTFWWATLSFINTLPPLMMDNRWRAEAWIGLNEHNEAKHYSFATGWPGNWIDIDEYI